MNFLGPTCLAASCTTFDQRSNMDSQKARADSAIQAETRDKTLVISSC